MLVSDFMPDARDHDARPFNAPVRELDLLPSSGEEFWIHPPQSRRTAALGTLRIELVHTARS